MYILHYRRKPSRIILRLMVLSLALIGGGLWAMSAFKTDTVIGQPPAAVTATVKERKEPVKTVDGPVYGFKLPSDWEAFTPSTQFPNTLNWHNTAVDKGVRIITVYADAAVAANLPVNRILPVQTRGDSLALTGEVSDNCVNFTDVKQQVSPGVVKARWQGVDFLCDAGNPVRHVTGIAVSGAMGGAGLTGPAGGKHTVLITYTDNSSTPNDQYLTDVVQSFHLK